MPTRPLIEKVIEAGRHTPSGSNSQTTHFIVITKKRRSQSWLDENEAVRDYLQGLGLADDETVTGGPYHRLAHRISRLIAFAALF